MIWKSKSVLELIKAYRSNDPIEIIREKSRLLVIEAFNRGWEGPPFDPIKLAQLIRCEVVPNETILDARIFNNKDDKLTIEYNPNQKESRINFSIAHEIGHTFFTDCKDTIRNREEGKDKDTWELEFLCNIAASEILLPYAQFSTEANSVPLNLESILAIANRYKASIESVFLRFCEVIEKPCTVILSSFTDSEQNNLVVEYSKASRSSPLILESGFRIPQNSRLYDCLNPGWTSYSTEKWPIFGEDNYKIFSIGLPPLKRESNTRVASLIVPELDSDFKEAKIYMVNGDATKPRGMGKRIIVQVINTTGGLGFGFGRAMTKAWPKSKKSVEEWISNRSDFELGRSKLTQLDQDIYVFQMLAQKGIHPKPGIVPLRYDSLKECLERLEVIANELKATVHMPQIGAGQAKGDWGIIEGLIYETLVSKGINVTIYVLPGTKIITPKKQSNLTLFDAESTNEK